MVEIRYFNEVIAILPDGFVESPLPSQTKPYPYVLNRDIKFEVSVVNEKLQIKELERWPDDCELKLPNGLLKRAPKTIHGYGGELLFYPNDTSKEPVNTHAYPDFIFMYLGRIFFVPSRGPGIIVDDRGLLCELIEENGEFGIRDIIFFREAPCAWAVFGSRLFIVSSSHFYEIIDFKAIPLFSRAFWRDLLPNSIAPVNNDNVFLGVLGGIVKLDLTREEVKFYRYVQAN